MEVLMYELLIKINIVLRVFVSRTILLFVFSITVSSGKSQLCEKINTLIKAFCIRLPKELILCTSA